MERLSSVSARTLATVSMLAVLSACSTERVDPPESRATTYMGRDLECVAYNTTGSHIGYDCDFAGFHADPQFEAPSTMPRIKDGRLTERIFMYKGGDLHCLIFATNNAYDEGGRTCDYTRFHQEYPRAE